MKNQILSGIRGFSRGLVFVALVASLVLGACEVIRPPVDEKQEVSNLGSYTVPDEDGMVRVTVKLPDDSSRSISSSLQALRYANYYEVIFKDRSTTLPVYYYDSQSVGESLNVKLPVNHKFDILFLAGYDTSKRVLLGNYFANDKDLTGAATYTPPTASAGLGYTIDAGVANIVTVSLTAVIIQPLTAYEFAWTGTALPDAPKVQTSNDLNILVNKIGPALKKISDGTTGTVATVGSDGVKAKLGGIETDSTVLKYISDAQVALKDASDIATEATAFANAVSDLGDGTGTGFIKDAVDATGRIAVNGNITNALASISELGASSTATEITEARAALPTLANIQTGIDQIQTAAETTAFAIAKLRAALALANEISGYTIGTYINTATTAIDSAWNALAVTPLTSVVAVGNDVIAQRKIVASVKTDDLILDLPTKSTLPSTVTDLTLTITLPEYLLPLIHAEGRVGTSNVVPTFLDNSVRLEPSERNSIVEKPSSVLPTNVSPVLSGTSNADVKFGYTFANADLPMLDYYAVLTFNVRYYPFGTSASNGGKAWTLRNGLDNQTVDNSGTPLDIYSSTTGGGIFVTIGQGGDILEDKISVAGY
jgi:hypothetical protein